jgi:Tfp pilus assembly protein PilV
MNARGQRGRIAPRSAEGAFLLLEVLLALFILTISVFVLIQGLSLCVAQVRSVQSYSTSAMLLANQSFVFRTERATDLLNQEGAFDAYPGYTWSRTLEQTDTEGLWKQVITVSWHERNQLANDSVVEYRYLPDKTR